MKIIRQIRQCQPVQRLEHEHLQLELDTASDRQPVQIPENKSNVFPPSADLFSIGLCKINKQFNKKTKLWKQNGLCLDDVTTSLVPIENWRKINMNF